MSEERIRLDQPSTQQEIPPATAVDSPRPGESGYVPPVDAVPLPSSGKIYPIDSPLFGSETIEIRSMTARDEDILSSRALLRTGRALNSLVQACVMNKAIDTEEMIAGDRNALLVAIRITGYGSEYEVDIQCENPECGEAFRHKFDLSKLEIKRLSVEPTAPGRNEFSFQLPVSKKPCVFKLLTGKDERDMAVMQERQKKILGAAATDEPVTTRLSFQIISIGQEKDRNKLRKIVQTLPAMDSRKLRKYIDDISPGIKMSQEAECPHCKRSEEVPVPFGTEFFWPES
jgi:hypothetical protein